jgi:hypothetical protein
MSKPNRHGMSWNSDVTIALLFSVLVGVFVLAFYAGPQALLQEATSGFADSAEVLYNLQRVFEVMPWLKHLVTRILFLFHESSKGVLTQIAVGGGLILKVGQETVKFFSS